MTGECAACGARDLRHQFDVAGDPGPEGLIPSTDRFGVALADMARCAACGHLQLETMPSSAELESGYAAAESEDYVEEEAGQRATARTALARIERHATRGRLLDVGCWVGFLGDEARRRGWEVTGIEPSRWAAAQARARGIEVIEEPLERADLPAAAFSVVTLGDMIEHVPDPGATLRTLARLLAPGGIVWLATPDAGSAVARAMGRRWWSVIPTHVHLFTRASISRLLERTGYEVLEIGTSPKAFTVAYYLGRLGGYSPSLGRVVVAAAARAGVADRIWAPDFRDRMAVVSRVRM